MCGPIGDIADVFVRWCLAYREGKLLDKQTAEKIAREVGSSFEIIAVDLDMSCLEDDQYRKELFDTAKKIRETTKGKNYVGIYPFFPVLHEPLIGYETGPVESFLPYVFGTLGPLAGSDLCIGESFGSEKGKNAVMLFAFCDDELDKKIRSEPQLDQFDYWYKYTAGKEKARFKRMLKDREKAIKEMVEELEEEKRKELKNKKVV